MAMSQQPLRLDMKLSQPNVGLIYPLNYDKTCLMEGLNDRGVNKSWLNDRGLNE